FSSSPRLGADEFLIGLCREQSVYFSRIRNLYFYQPAFAIRIFVDFFSAPFQYRVHFRNLSADRHEEIGHGLDGSNCAEDVLLRGLLALGADMQVHDVAQFALSEIGNAYGCAGTFTLDPFMIFGLPEFFWNIHSSNL